uniref:Phage portal protein, lambda family n=1 Tax=Candidatus Kentrum sp. FM TaxID=2126340 RepID=A0A450T302_9GAMM|nr:MAG: Phage portal protein, lambda family [Candidatus Kentron sp. FM]VFJ60852.1 MAG: Phage portal protein, lambda family [Candidatus Kentron sp. FM]VFK13117.1 MAG: Phage portal protein, lambda family [Candidatus Kentron sp. FM]
MGGEVLATAEWLPDRGGPYDKHYATAIQIIDPARLCNPNDLMDTDRLRAGVELDRHGAPRAYHIREAMQGDCFVYLPLGFADRLKSQWRQFF